MNERADLAPALDTLAGPWRGLVGLTAVLGGGAMAVAAFAVAAWVIRFANGAAPLATLAAWLVAVIAVAVGLWAAHRAMARLTVYRTAAILESSGHWRTGALTMLLSPAAPGTSAELHQEAVRASADGVRTHGHDAMAPVVTRARRRTARTGALLGAGMVVLVAARPAGTAGAAIWHPVEAWRGLVAPVGLRARHATVSPGESATFDIEAIGRRRATVMVRSLGQGWRTIDVALDADGHAIYRSEPLSNDIIARAEAAGHHSAEVRVSVRTAAFLSGVTLTAHYPRYLELQDEHLPMTGDTLVVPEGTRLTLAGRATAGLVRAEWRSRQARATATVQGNGFTAAVEPHGTDVWTLHVESQGGDTVSGSIPATPVRVVPDSAPRVDIPIPGIDTVATTAMSLPLVVSIRDDHGIAHAALAYRRNGTPGESHLPLTLPAGTTDRALIATTVDLSVLHLQPGDTLRYWAVADDNAPISHQGRSRVLIVRIPTPAERRAQRHEATVSAAQSFDSLAHESSAAQQATSDLAMQRQRSASASGSANQPLSNAAAREASVAAHTATQVMRDATALQQRVDALRRDAEQNGGADTALARQLGDINALLDRALSPDLRASLAALQQALQSLDADATRQALANLSQQQAALRSAIDQARQLFARAALETQLGDLSTEAKDLADHQADETGKVARRDTAAAAEEQSLAARTDSFAAQLAKAAQQVPAAKPSAALAATADSARAAAASMRQASSLAPSNASGAAQSARTASDQLNPLSKQIDQNRQSMAAEMRAEVEARLNRALQEAGNLADQQNAVAASFAHGMLSRDVRTQQSLVDEGAGRLAAQLTQVSAMNALVSPQAGVAVAEARDDMQAAIAAVSSVTANPRVATERSAAAVDALAMAAYSLLQSKDQVQGSQSGTGLPEAMRQLEQMAGTQQRLASQGQQILGNGGATPSQILAMALAQRALQQQLERLRAGGFPGAGDIANEARELTRSLEAGRLDQDVVQHQEQLFKKMLDAGRSLTGDQQDDSKERHAETAKDAPPEIPPALDARIRNGAGEIRLPSWESLQRLSPEQRRQVFDYFARLARTSGPGATP